MHFQIGKVEKHKEVSFKSLVERNVGEKVVFIAKIARKRYLQRDVLCDCEPKYKKDTNNESY